MIYLVAFIAVIAIIAGIWTMSNNPVPTSTERVTVMWQVIAMICLLGLLTFLLGPEFLKLLTDFWSRGGPPIGQ